MGATKYGNPIQKIHHICKNPGEEVWNGDVFYEQGFDISFLKVVGAVQVEGIVPDVHRRQLIEPGGDGGFREILL